MKKLFAFAIFAVLFAACTKEDNDYIVTDYASDNFTETIPYWGGTYTVRFTTDIVSRAKFENWQYRIDIGDEQGEPVLVSELTESIDVAIDANYDIADRYIVVETAVAGSDEWKKAVVVKQESALIKAGDYYWAKGNVTLRDGKFAIAANMSDQGLYFFSGSKYGIPSDAAYAGTAYAPEPVRISLRDAHKDEAFDVCNAINPTLRLPSRGELENLASLGLFEEPKMDLGILCMPFDGTRMLLPYAGFLGFNYNEPTMVSSYGVYWGNGRNFDGNNLIYVFNAASEMPYSLIDFDRTDENTGSVRCVRNIVEPTYVSHSPEAPADHKEFELTVETTAGDFKDYLVEVEASDNTYEKVVATPANTTAKLTIPANESITDDVTFKIFVNGHFTGKTFVQPAMTGYALYKEHTPVEEQTFEAFTLTVTCVSDLDSFTVEANGSDNTVVSGTGSKSNLSVALAIPENTAIDQARTFRIFVNGNDTGKSVKQAGAPAPKPELSVTWSEGYLTVNDGAYTFADKNERGMFFKWKSKWGVPFNATAYQGKAYGPDEVSYTKFADVPQTGDTDPCSLVAPAGTWYLPTKAQILELGTADISIDVKKSLTVSDGKQTLVFIPAGQMAATATKPSLPDSSVLIWSGEASTTAGKAGYMMWSVTSTTTTPRANDNNVKNGMMVRCVRNK